MSEEKIDVSSLKNLKVVKGARHCRIVDEDDNVIFRTTNLRDAEAYLHLIEENQRLLRLLDARGIAPHRIYLLNKAGSREEVVIVAKADDEAVVVRNLNDGSEEAVELDELKPLPRADYFSGSETSVENIYVSVRIDREAETALVQAHRSQEGARSTREVWRRASFEVDKSAQSTAAWSDENNVVFIEEVMLEE